MKIALGNDHAAVELKKYLVEKITAAGHEVIDVGVNSTESVDYPVYGAAGAHEVAQGRADRALLICGTGVGIGISANKVPGIRCAICSEPYSAEMSRRHNDANALAIGARVVGPDLAWMIVETWLAAEYEGGRHDRRVELINDLDGDTPDTTEVPRCPA
ncbi:ribose 5-phosphate isomerase B [Enemella sp. A6]|uniref:ribose 5-phosphate isomerase B n=1 Tax=Enemella sp. A6 TaxID=3440152 RepID=UPI003EBB21F0